VAGEALFLDILEDGNEGCPVPGQFAKVLSSKVSLIELDNAELIEDAESIVEAVVVLSVIRTEFNE